jgi:cephalosporin hydroxylase
VNQTRSFDTALPGDVLTSVQAGVLRTSYRGVPFWKSPFDVVLYLQLLQQLRPRTVIEIGSKFGGSALWFADMISAAGDAPRIVSIDLKPPHGVKDDRIVFLAGNALNLGAVLTNEVLDQLPRPWLVSEDSAHLETTCTAVLNFFEPLMASGEYIVIEDGIVAHLPEATYRAYEEGPNRAVAAFLERTQGRYEIDGALCDLFGQNVTYNPNGWLRRTS